MNNEINLNEPFGQLIYQTVIEYSLKTNLEIGSWDGEGSTFCFVEAMKQLTGSKLLGCVEVDKQKISMLANMYSLVNFVTPIHGSSVNYDELVYKDFESVWNSPFNKINKNSYSKELVKSWFDRDIELLKRVKKSAISYYKDVIWDSVLIDGGEFSGYSEYKLLKDKTKVLFLDDVHSAFKCYEIYTELQHDSSWELMQENSSVRNGYAVFIRKQNSN